MKTWAIGLLIFVLSAWPTHAIAANDTVSKTVCKLAVGYEKVDDIKADLLIAAKREVINELFGELIVASTAVENFVVTSDQIRASSIGFVRVDGSADFKNGASFAEVCVTINGYVTASDQQKFEPIKLQKKLCDSNNDMTTAQLISYVKDEAIIQALIEYNPKLKDADHESLLQLVQKVTYRASGFITDTQTYCATFEGYVVPIELMAFLETKQVTGGKETSDSKSVFKSGKYLVQATTSKQYDSTWTVEIVEGRITGLSEWGCCPGSRIDPLSGTVIGNKVVIQRDCSGQGAGSCLQTFTGTIVGDVISGQFSGTGGTGSWKLYLQEEKEQ